MEILDHAYAQLLRVGFVVLKQAIDSKHPDWVQAELEWLHNVPSLLGEENVERHRYFWDEERIHYLDWVLRQGSDEAKSRMKTYYEPLLNELEPLFTQAMETAGGETGTGPFVTTGPSRRR